MTEIGTEIGMKLGAANLQKSPYSSRMQVVLKLDSVQLNDGHNLGEQMTWSGFQTKRAAIGDEELESGGYLAASLATNSGLFRCQMLTRCNRSTANARELLAR